MSYILDALRRAEAQRERGAVPGVHAQPQAALPLAHESRRPQRMMWLLGAAALVLVVAGAWLFFMRSAPREAVTPAVLAQAPAAITAPPVAIAPQALPVAPLAAGPVSPAPAASPAPAPAPSTASASESKIDAKAAARAERAAARAEAKAARVAAAQARAASAPDKATAVASTASGAASAAPATTTAEKPATAAPRLYSREELPGDIRGQLPKVTISGSTYSENAAHRLLIANGQVFHEGEKVAADLTVEQIGLKAVVLNYRGYRYSVPY
jgi:general secretion pathway protein B